MKTLSPADTVAAGKMGASLPLLMIALAVMDLAHGQTYTSMYDALSKLPVYATLKTVVDVANMTAVLSDPNLTAILLAPDNTAWQNTLSAFPGTAQLVSNASAISAVLTYHFLPVANPNAELNITGGATTLSSLLSSNAAFQAGTLANVTFRTMPADTSYVGGLPPGSLLTLNESIIAGKGRIYTLTNGILVPPSKLLSLTSGSISLTIAELLQNTPGFANLSALIAADTNLTKLMANPDNAVTIFAPPDSAFAALFQTTGMTLDGIKASMLARRIILNHIIPLRPFTSSQLLPSGTSSNTITTYSSAYTGDMLNITVSGTPPSSATVQGGGNRSPINIAISNIPAGKSIVHVVAGIIMPYNPAFLSASATPPGAMLPPGAVTPPGAMSPPGTNGTASAAAPPSPPMAASMTIASTWLLTTLLGAALVLGFRHV